MVELAYTTDLKSVAERLMGSNPIEANAVEAFRHRLAGSV